MNIVRQSVCIIVLQLVKSYRSSNICRHNCMHLQMSKITKGTYFLTMECTRQKCIHCKLLKIPNPNSWSRKGIRTLPTLKTTQDAYIIIHRSGDVGGYLITWGVLRVGPGGTWGDYLPVGFVRCRLLSWWGSVTCEGECGRGERLKNVGTHSPGGDPWGGGPCGGQRTRGVYARLRRPHRGFPSSTPHPGQRKNS